MNEYEKIILPETVLDVDLVDGTKVKRELMAAFRADNGKCYFALSSMDNNNEPQEDIIELVRAVILNNGEDYALEFIDTEEEFHIARTAFENVCFSRQNVDDDILDMNSAISLQNKEGEFEGYELIDIFECNGIEYVALASEAEVNENDITVRLMRLDRVSQHNEEGFRVTAILSKEEYDEALATFERRIESI